MSRAKHSKGLKRVQLRLADDVRDVCDRLSSEQISEVLEVAIRSGVRPGSKLGTTTQAIIRPEKLRTKTIARIAASESGLVGVLFPEKLEAFKDVAGSLGYRWAEWRWERQVEPTVLCDRLAELAHNLLLKGFAVQVEHSEVRDKAVTGDYEPEAFRRVKCVASGVYKGWFVFEYPRSEDYYQELMGLTGAKYADKLVRVPPEHFAEVEDFAEQHSFVFSQKAREVLESARSLWESALLVIPVRKKKQDAKKSPLESMEVEIPDALKDDDS